MVRVYGILHGQISVCLNESSTFHVSFAISGRSLESRTMLYFIHVKDLPQSVFRYPDVCDYMKCFYQLLPAKTALTSKIVSIKSHIGVLDRNTIFILQILAHLTSPLSITLAYAYFPF